MRERIEIINLIGQQFHKLTILGEGDKVYKNGSLIRMVNCKCECGNIVDVPLYSVIHSNTKSCGCMAKRLASERLSKRNFKHGRHTSPEYHSWKSMKYRCESPKCESYRYYGAKGIKVCERWKNSFENFFMDMGEKPSHRHSLDRKDSTKDYTPENCRWATPKEQSRNTKRTIYITIEGVSRPMCEWAEILGVKRDKLYRLFRMNKINNQ